MPSSLGSRARALCRERPRHAAPWKHRPQAHTRCHHAHPRPQCEWGGGGGGGGTKSLAPRARAAAPVAMTGPGQGQDRARTGPGHGQDRARTRPSSPPHRACVKMALPCCSREPRVLPPHLAASGSAPHSMPPHAHTRPTCTRDETQRPPPTDGPLTLRPRVVSRPRPGRAPAATPCREGGGLDRSTRHRRCARRRDHLRRRCGARPGRRAEGG